MNNAVRISAQTEGAETLVRNLNIIEKKVLPRADANALNRTATSGRKNGIKRIAQHEKRKRKAFRSIVRVAKRARARMSQYAVVAVYRRQDVANARLSKPFYLQSAKRGPGIYRRRIPGKARTDGRPVTSPPNLPIYPDRDNVRERRNMMVEAECRRAMREYYPGELRAQLDRLVAKFIRRRSRR